MEFSHTLEHLPLEKIDKDYALHELKKSITHSVWSSSVLEGHTFTLPEVQTIMSGRSIGGSLIDDEQEVLDIARGWKLTITAIENGREANEDLARELNATITKNLTLAPGIFRGEPGSPHGDGGNVRIKDGIYIAPSPQELRDVWDSFHIDDDNERCLLRVPFMSLAQFFWDGNKRTAVMLNCVDLINHDFPAIYVSGDKVNQWHESLNILFSTKNADPLIELLHKSQIK